MDRETLVEAYQAGHLLNAVSVALSPDEEERKALVSELVALHNEKLINMAEIFGGLHNDSELGPDFFLMRRVFEKALPQLEASVQEVIQCVLQLYREAGEDMAAGTVFAAFVEFCSQQSARPQEALAAVENNPEQFADLLVPTLAAGSRIDPALYLNETTRLCQHSSIEIRRRAILALGRITLKDDINTDPALSALEHVLSTDEDGSMLGSAVRSAFALATQNSANQIRLHPAIARALSRGNEYALHAASEVFGLQTDSISPGFIQELLSHLIQVRPENKGTIGIIDHGISRLLEGAEPNMGLKFLEDFILAHPEELTLKSFGTSARTIFSHAGLRRKVLTRWLLRGSYPLCIGLDALSGSPGGNSVELEVDPDELTTSDPSHFTFIARKVIGYLFLKPLSAASFLISLMRHANNSDTDDEIGSLLFNPLLLNFSGELKDYVAQRVSTESGNVKATIEKALQDLDAYIEGLKSVDFIPAFQPSEDQRRAYQHYISQITADSFKAAREESSLLQLFPVSILLYGRKGVSYIYSAEGGPNRIETPLLSHGTEFEVPRMSILDPHGLDCMLRIFQRERLTV